jgi:hypothetical protein
MLINYKLIKTVQNRPQTRAQYTQNIRDISFSYKANSRARDLQIGGNVAHPYTYIPKKGGGNRRYTGRAYTKYNYEYD